MTSSANLELLVAAVALGGCALQAADDDVEGGREDRRTESQWVSTNGGEVDFECDEALYEFCDVHVVVLNYEHLSLDDFIIAYVDVYEGSSAAPAGTPRINFGTISYEDSWSPYYGDPSATPANLPIGTRYVENLDTDLWDGTYHVRFVPAPAVSPTRIEVVVMTD